MPESAKEAAKEDAKRKGHKDAWRFTLQGPSVMPVMQYLDSDEIRRQVWEASNAVGREEPYDNTELIDKI